MRLTFARQNKSDQWGSAGIVHGDIGLDVILCNLGRAGMDLTYIACQNEPAMRYKLCGLYHTQPIDIPIPMGVSARAAKQIALSKAHDDYSLDRQEELRLTSKLAVKPPSPVVDRYTTGVATSPSKTLRSTPSSSPTNTISTSIAKAEPAMTDFIDSPQFANTRCHREPEVRRSETTHDIILRKDCPKVYHLTKTYGREYAETFEGVLLSGFGRAGHVGPGVAQCAFSHSVSLGAQLE